MILNTASSYQLCDKIYPIMVAGVSDVFISLDVVFVVSQISDVLSELCLPVILVTPLPLNYNIVSRYPHLPPLQSPGWCSYSYIH